MHTFGDGILDSVKKVIGFERDYEAFDVDLIMHINSAFAILHQLGVGPVNGFFITDYTSKWQDFIGDLTNIQSVKTYVCLRVRLLFDPPATSFAISSFESQMREIEWRLKTALDPDVPVVVVEEVEPVW